MRPVDADYISFCIDEGYRKMKKMNVPNLQLMFTESCNNYCKALLDKSDTVDLNCVIHAKWNLADDGDGIVCSHCGEDFCTIIYEQERLLYCPHCGAKMDGEV